MTEAEKRRGDGVLIRRLLTLPAFEQARTVFLYLGVGAEPDTRPALRAALARGKTVALPRVTGPGLMEAGRVRALSELRPDRYGIPAPPPESGTVPPECFDLILVPGAAFTRDGGRLGRGGGYYDRYLPQTRGVKAALVRAFQLFPALPIQPHDIPVDLLLTDAGEVLIP